MRGSQQVKRLAISHGIRTLLALASRASDKDVYRFFSLLEKIAPDEQAAGTVRSVKKAWDEGHPFALLMRRLIDEVDPHCRNQLVSNFILNNSWGPTRARREAFQQEEGFPAPYTYLLSPTMRCNLRCVGCYASEYDIKDDLPLELIDRVLTEGKEMGIYFITILGGEPFIRQDMWEIYEKHNDMAFQVYTNGTLIDDKTAKRLASLGNVVPVISLEGFEQETDARRGKGTFARATEAMDFLHQAGVPFGFSSMVTRQNVDTIVSDEFNEMLIEKGCLFGWHFLYMPVGRNPDLTLMPTPEQRNRLRVEGAARIRVTKPLFIADFWNDAPYVGGCIAGGRQYFHVNSRGDVEPCIFVHFATHNVKRHTLREALRAPLFQAIRSRQPFGEDLLRPCMIIDHPEILREIYSETSPYPTHDGADSMLTCLSAGLDEYAREVASVMDPAWQTDFVAKGFQVAVKTPQESKQLAKAATGSRGAAR